MLLFSEARLQDFGWLGFGEQLAININHEWTQIHGLAIELKSVMFAAGRICM